MIKRILGRFFVCAALPALLCIGCTGNEPQASIEITNGDCTGTIYASDLSVAGNAIVRLIPEGYDPHNPVTGTIDSTITDKNGRYSFFVNRPDIYTIIAEKDGASSITQSIPLQPEASVVVNDTLQQPGTLAGRVILSAGEDARMVIILVRGTDYYITPSDSSGNFTSPPLPEGTFTIQMIVPGSERYANLDTTVMIISGKTTELLAVLKSADAPLVNGLTVRNDSITMFATISWQPADTSAIESYVLYRTTAAKQDTALTLAKSTTSYVDDIVLMEYDTFTYGITAIAKISGRGFGQWPIRLFPEVSTSLQKRSR